MQAIYVLLLSLFVSMVLIPPLSRFAPALGLTDKPDSRKIHTKLIPRTGGIAIVIGAITPVLLWVPWRADLRAFVLAVGVLFIFGVLDDRFNLNYRLKLLGQLLAALTVTLGGGVMIDQIPFLGTLELPPAVAVPLTVFALVAVTNAVNLSDGLDGLAGGISLLALGCLSILAYQGEDVAALMVAFAMMGATFGFLRFNTHPAQIFMGDTGSQFLGFGTGVLAIIVTQSDDCAVSKLIPVLILGMPILDTLTVMVRRIAEGRSPFSADRLHLHHQLLAAGLNQYQAVALVYIAQALLILLAYLMRYSADLFVLAVYLVFAATILVSIGLLSRHHTQAIERRLPAGVAGLWLAFTSLLNLTRLMTRVAYQLLRVLVPLVLLLGALVAPSVSRDVALLAGVLLVGLLLLLWLSPQRHMPLERLIAFVTAVAVVYLASGASLLQGQTRLLLALFALIGILTAVRVRYSTAGFEVSSMDLLILLIALVLPTLSGPWFDRYGLEALESVILFYAIEVSMVERSLMPYCPLRIGMGAALLLILVKGFY